MANVFKVAIDFTNSVFTWDEIFFNVLMEITVIERGTISVVLLVVGIIIDSIIRTSFSSFFIILGLIIVVITVIVFPLSLIFSPPFLVLQIPIQVVQVSDVSLEQE